MSNIVSFTSISVSTKGKHSNALSAQFEHANVLVEKPIGADVWPQCHMELELILSRISLLGEPRLTLARSGDVAAAIGIAVPAERDESIDPYRLDIIMSSVLLSALRGSAAVALVRTGPSDNSRMAADFASSALNVV